MAIRRQEHVARLDVAMNDAAIVCVAQSPAHFDADLRGLTPLELPPTAQFFFKAATVDQLHRIEQMAFLMAEAEEADNVGMIKLAKGFDLALKPDAKAFFFSQRRRQQFYGRRLAGLAVDRLVHNPHAASAELADDLIGAEPLEFHGKDWGSGIGDCRSLVTGYQTTTPIYRAATLRTSRSRSCNRQPIAGPRSRETSCL